MSGLTAMQEYRLLFIALAVALLALAAADRFRQGRKPDCECTAGEGRETRTDLLILLGAFVAPGVIISPWLLPNTVTDNIPATTAVEGETQRVTLEIDGMTCKACTATITHALKLTPGVLEVGATYAPPQVVVRYDPRRVAIDQMVTAVTGAGYRAALRSDLEAPHDSFTQ